MEINSEWVIAATINRVYHNCALRKCQCGEAKEQYPLNKWSLGS